MDDDIIEIVAMRFEKYCDNENYNKIEEFLKIYKFLANYDNGNFFEIVANKGNLDLIKLFIKYDAIINIDDGYILYTCIEKKHNECVEYLLKNGADLELCKNKIPKIEFNKWNDYIINEKL